MKTSYVLILVLFSHLAFCQVKEDFFDGNFTSSPKWYGDTSFFKVNSTGQLQSQGPAASSIIHLSTPNYRLANTQWSFFAKLGFQPSTTNYAKVYLSSDQQDLEKPLNGYYLKIGGEPGNTDGIDLYRQNGLLNTKIIDGVNGHAGKSTNNLKIKVIRDHQGRWTIFADTLGGSNFIIEGTAVDSSIRATSFFGISCIHSSTRKDLFFFDDFLIEEAPIQLIKVQPVNDTTIDAFFSKALDPATAENSTNYQIDQTTVKFIVHLDNPTKVRLFLSSPLKNASYILKVNNIKDISGNSISIVNSCSFIYKKRLQYGDILITEIFSDPSPAVELPSEEFIEILNTTKDTIDLSGFVFSDASTSVVLPSYQLPPSEYLIVTTAEAVPSYKVFGNVIGISPWPSLNNSEDILTLKDEPGNPIFDVQYFSSWHQNSLKSDGGWSLEMKNLNEYCTGAYNWTSSSSLSGGSPGQVNTVFSNIPDLTSPALNDFEILDSLQILLKFNEAIDNLVLPSHLVLSKGIMVEKIIFQDPGAFIIRLNKSLILKTSYQLEIKNIKDCKGNTSEDQILNFQLPELSDAEDIIINEVLFNPLPNGVDYVEIYNRSDKCINLKNWKLGTIKLDTVADFKLISSGYLILNPGDYMCLTPDPSIVKYQYNVSFIESLNAMTGFPSYNDDKGSVILTDMNNKTIDRFDYNEKFHFNLLDDKEGVSLERLSFYAPTQNRNNWHSAASTSGYGTPGYENSQKIEENSQKNISVTPKVFTPDLDSWKDLAFINFKFNEPGNVASISIYDIKGRRVKTLAKNELLNQEGFFQWDGTNENGQLAATGHYIVFFEIFNIKGEATSFKETVVLASRF
jgi:hypothetical protein